MEEDEALPVERQGAAQQEAQPEAEKKKVTVDITSEELQYDQEQKAYVATGLVHVVVSEQNAILDADKITYDQDNDVIVAEGNVRIERNGEVTTGSFARVDLNRESALINDANTEVSLVRIKSEKAYVDEEFVHLENGRLIIDRTELLRSMGQGSRALMPIQNKPQATPKLTAQTLKGRQAEQTVSDDRQVFRSGFIPHLLSSPNARYFIDSDFLKTQPKFDGDFLSYYKGEGLQLDTSELASEQQEESPFTTTVNHVDVQQYPDGYQEVTLNWPKVKYRDVPIFTYPAIDVGLNKESGRFDYLGPEAGYNRDLGGFFAGPGFDLKAGEGVFKISPLLSYGPEIDRSDGVFTQEDNVFGVGINARYMDDSRRIEFARTSQVNYNVIYAEQQLFRNTELPVLKDGNLRLIASNNFSYGGNLLTGIERPQFSAQLSDDRIAYTNQHFTVSTHGSVGVFQDEFNPNNTGQVFVARTSNEPQTEGRALFQFLLTNNDPLFQVGDYLDFGYNVQGSIAGYSTGDHQGILRGGPTATFRFRDRFLSQAYYAMGAQSGTSPFVFDGFFLGKQSLTLNNALRINKYLTIGARNDLSLLRDNAENTTLVGNMIYASVGPPDLKFTIGFDVIRRLSFFGLNFYPSNGFSNIDFATANVYQPKVADPDGIWKSREEAEEARQPSERGAQASAPREGRPVSPAPASPAPAQPLQPEVNPELQPLLPVALTPPDSENRLPQPSWFQLSR